MATVATLETRMALNSTAFRQGMIQAASQANASLGSISKQAGATASVLLSLKRAANTFGSFYFVKEGLSSLIEAQKQLQAIQFTLMAATGSSTLAADAFQFVRDESQKLGLVLPTAAQGFANLSASATAAGVSLSDQKELFDAYARSSTTLHLSTEQSSRALLALEQMFAKGKIQAQELRLQLGQAIPGAAQRFQNAVMEMTKGTSLAGKSFDQLLAAGDLTTSKFLPALVKALQDSGRGVEQAAQGLQANLNRVQTAWFNLKTEVSGGLFNDAATAGAGLLADNLSRIAGLVTLIGAGGLAKISGGALDSGASKVVRLQQEYKGAQMAAAAEAAYAEKIAATAAAEQAAAAAQKEMLVARQANGAQLIAQNQAIQFEAQAQAESAIALKAEQLALDEASRSATVMEAAEERLALAITAATEAQARVNAEMALGTDISTRLTAAQGRLAAAETAVAAAQARVAETKAAEAALGGLGAAAGRAAQSFGAFALSLVGGPWGAAVLAIGGIGYAIYSAQKQGEEWRKETAAQVESLKQLTETAKAAADEYGRLGSNMTLSQGISTLDSSQKELNDKREAIQKLREEAQRLQAVLAANPDNTQNAIANGFTAQKIEQLTTRIKELEAELPPAQQATGALSDELRARLTPAVDGLKKAIAAVKNGGGLVDFIRNLASPQDIASGIKDIEHAQQLANSALGAMSTLGDKARKDLLTKGKSRVDQLNAELAVATSNIRAQRLSAEKEAESLAAAQAEYAKQLPDARKADIADNAKKTASGINQAANAYTNLKNAQEGQLATLRGQLAGTDGYSEAQKALNVMLAGGTSEFRKMTTAKQADVIATQKQIVAMQLDVDKRNLQIASARQLADLDRQIAEEQADRARKNAAQVEGVGHGSEWNAERQAIDEVTDATRKQIAAESARYDSAIEDAKNSGKLGALQKQLDDDHLQRLGKITAAGALDAKSTQDNFDAMKAAQADWSKGAQAALEDIQSSAADAAGAAKTLFTDSFNSAADALANFVTTGKGNFADLAQSILSDLVKIETRILLSQALTSMFGGGMGTAAGYNSATPQQQVAYDVSVSGGRRSGGPVAGGNLYEVAEGGAPELLTSSGRTYLMMGAQGGQVTPASAAWGGSGAGQPRGEALGGVQVEINITNNGQAVQATQTGSRMDGKKMMIDLILDTVSGDTAKGGRTALATQQRFGLQRRGVPVGA